MRVTSMPLRLHCSSTSLTSSVRGVGAEGGDGGWYDRVKEGTVRDRSHGAATPTISLPCN